MVCVIDVDNIILNLTEQTIRMYNNMYNENISMGDLTSYNFYDCLPKKTSDQIIELFSHKDLWDSLTPISGSQRGIERLIKYGHTILLATATHEINFPWKCDLIKKFFPDINDRNIIRIYDKSLIRADVIVDDDLSQLTRSFADRICLTYPWNIDDSKDFVYGINRCNNWVEITDVIQNIEKEANKYE